MASIKERGGSYLITVSCGYDIYGKKLTKTATFTPDPALTPKKREKAIAEFAADFERAVKNDEVPDGRNTTLKAFADRWMEEAEAAQELQPRTLEGYRAELNDKILPALGHLKLTELRPANLKTFFVSLTKDGVRKDGKPGGYSRATIKKTQNVLSSLLGSAVELELINQNPMLKKAVRKVGNTASATCKFFTPEQAAIFLDYLEQPQTITTKGHTRIDDTGIKYTVGSYQSATEVPEQYRVLYNLAVYSGLRKGELLALQWTDIDFDNCTVSVTKACSVVGGKQITKCPKTENSIRVVTIPSFLIRRLKELRRARIEYRLSLGDYWQGDNWVFIQENGRQMSYYTPKQTMVKIIKRYNANHKDQLPAIPFHGLRHTSATLLIASKQDIRTVSSRLGHSQASTTLNIYAHALKENDRRASDALENILVKHA